MTQQQPRKAPPPPPPVNGGRTAPPAAAQAAPSGDRFAIVGGTLDMPQRVVLYGPAGVGKSTLAALAPNPVFLDLEGGTRRMNVPRVEGVETYEDLRACLQSSALDAYGTIVCDTYTRCEEMATAHVLQTVQHEKGGRVSSLEGYGFGKGLSHVYEACLRLLADFDSQVRRGRHVVLIAHDCTSDVPNPTGEDFIRFEPHLQAPKSGKSSVRNRVVQWADHVLFVGYDTAAIKGKGVGSGTRTIYTYELPSHVAKSRDVREALPFEDPNDGKIWSLILPGGAR